VCTGGTGSGGESLGRANGPAGRRPAALGFLAASGLLVGVLAVALSGLFEGASALPSVAAVERATTDALLALTTGPSGLVTVFTFSVLVAVVLPIPGELVLLAPLQLGLPRSVELAVLVLVSSLGKALGSLLALEVSTRTAHSTPARRLAGVASVAPPPLSALLAWIQRLTERLIRRHGTLGLVFVLSVPGWPDTVVLYAFGVFGIDRTRFVLAAFLGSAIRLTLVVLVVGGVVAVA